MLGPLLFASLASAAPTSTTGPALQVAVLVDDSVFVPTDMSGERLEVAPAVIRDLAILEGRLRDAEGEAEVADLACANTREGLRARILSDFGSNPEFGLTARLLARTRKARRLRCTLDTDVLTSALEGPAWRPEARRHLVLVTRERARVRTGRRTFEEVARDAEHAGVVLHALAFDDSGGEDALKNLQRDLRSFMARPTSPLGRPAVHLRHGVLLTGGRYFVSVLGPFHPGDFRPLPKLPRVIDMSRFGEYDLDTLRVIAARTSGGPHQLALEEIAKRRAADPKRDALREAWSLEATYGPRVKPERDVLTELAAGRLRPSQVRPEHRPAFLEGYAIEPLLDAVWDFVDAREGAERVISSAAANWAARGEGPPLVGAPLADAVLGAPRLPPSRR